MSIETFDKKSLQTLRAEMDAALNTVAEKHGITLKLKGIRFDLASFTVTVEGQAGSFHAPCTSRG